MKKKYYNPKKLQVSSGLYPRFNAAEKYVMMTIAYSGNLIQNSDLEEAVRTKNLPRLIKVVNDRNVSDILEHRRETITDNHGQAFQETPLPEHRGGELIMSAPRPRIAPVPAKEHTP